MLKKHNQLFKGLLLISDLFFISLAWWLAYVLRFHTDLFAAPEPFRPRHYWVAWLMILVVWASVFEWADFYRPRRLSTHQRENIELLKCSAVALLIFLGVLFLIREVVISRLVVVVFWFASIILIAVSHHLFREGLRLARRRGYNLRHVLVIGTAALAGALASRLASYKRLGLRVVGIYLTEGELPPSANQGVSRIASEEDLMRVIRNGAIDQIFVALPLEQAPKLRSIQEMLGDEPVTLHYVPDLGDLATLHGSVEEFDGLQIISLQSTPLAGWNAFLKRALDLSLGTSALILLAPLMALIAVAIKSTSRGPVFYRQERMGLDGRRFTMLKFRTMVEDAEKHTGPVWASDDDPRVTAVGRWLRATSLDELPQLINVLRGEMSLVGPRPERPPLIEEFRSAVPKYMLRHKMKAGMTGWAQVNGWRGNTSLKHRIEYDLDYIENWSLWRDIKILAQTLLGGFRNRRARGA
ncbi:MAG TPA: undecaprenyl-phosphate glucose phosphotransferase [Methylomirabilota bacterium]|nr:undecaprenyl-phosphate glucose phosphotransferase [Methylomirabilota bacterium]